MESTSKTIKSDIDLGSSNILNKTWEPGHKYIKQFYGGRYWGVWVPIDLDSGEIVEKSQNITIFFDYFDETHTITFESKNGFKRRQLSNLIVNKFNELYKAHESKYRNWHLSGLIYSEDKYTLKICGK